MTGDTGLNDLNIILVAISWGRGDPERRMESRSNIR